MVTRNKMLVWRFCVLVLFHEGVKSGRTSPRSIRIGGLFEPEHESLALALEYAVDRINARRDLLPSTTLLADVQRSTAGDSFGVSKKLCRQIEDGVAAIFGPMSTFPAAHVQSICDTMEIPHIETRWDFHDHRDFFIVNLYPHYLSMSRAYVDYVKHFKWTSFIILYEHDDGLIRLQELLKAPTDYRFEISVQKLEADNGDYRPLLKRIQKFGGTRMVLDCSYKTVRQVFLQALSINMMTPYYHYMLTTLDVSLVDLDEFKYGGANITAFQLIDPTRQQVIDVTNDWILGRVRTGTSPLEEEKGMRTHTALVYDAVLLFATALTELMRAQDVSTSHLSCNRVKPWVHGSSLINYLMMTEIEGLTGRVQFDNEGRRSDFHLDVVGLHVDGLQKVGTWNPTDGINITKDYSSLVKEVASNLKNKTLIVTTILEDPYVMLKEDGYNSIDPNDRFEGFCVDLLAEISKLLNFNYSIHLVADGKYGSMEGIEWTGMIRELMDKKADLAVASLTISYVREQVIDFTKPFMNLGISILFKRPDKTNPSLFSFLAPLSFEIWIYVVAAYLGVSFMLFVLARFTPYEWYNPHPCNQDSDVMENQFTLANSLWFTIGSLMQQGSEIVPRAVSTRIISGIWWFFTLIIISSYTANLAAFLTVERMTSPIENADDLSKQTEIKYGPIYGGSTMTFFKTSKIPTYERMWNFMSSAKPSVFVNSTKEGVQRIREGKFAYLLESTMNEYITQRDCSLMRVGGLLDSKGYGIGTPRGSPFRDLLSDAILKLQEDQILQVLYNKWWKQKGGAGQCDDDDGKQDANSLGFSNVGGVFVVLICGLVLSLVVVIIEFVWKAQKDSAIDRQPLCSQMLTELRFATQCFGSSTRPKIQQRDDSVGLADGSGARLMAPVSDYITKPPFPTAPQNPNMFA